MAIPALSSLSLEGEHAFSSEKLQQGPKQVPGASGALITFPQGFA